MIDFFEGQIYDSYSLIIDIIKNEKYKGDLLQGKTFIVDPITHRKLENMGEEQKC